jgi:hypothetical protein
MALILSSQAGRGDCPEVYCGPEVAASPSSSVKNDD